MMLLDIELYFDHPDRLYSPGDTITCKVDIRSRFNLKCRFVRARLRCPFKSKEVEYFRVYEIARKRITRTDKDQWEYKIGEKGVFVRLVSIKEKRRLRLKNILLRLMV